MKPQSINGEKTQIGNDFNTGMMDKIDYNNGQGNHKIIGTVN